MNVETDLDVANGSRGEVVDIILDAQEPDVGQDDIVHLTRPPACILVKLNNAERIQLRGLRAGVVPIQPAFKSFRLPKNRHYKEGFEVTREQYCLTPAYAFTDYRGQGQTLSYLFVDIAPPPTGGPLTVFNVYVALSRSSGRNTIRLLRDYDCNALLKPIPDFLAKEDNDLRRKDQETRLAIDEAYEREN